jgi:hypothetical protein
LFGFAARTDGRTNNQLVFLFFYETGGGFPLQVIYLKQNKEQPTRVDARKEEEIAKLQ